MALLNDIELENGLSVEGAYHRITKYKGDERQLFFTVSVYVNKEFYIEEKTPLATFSHGMGFDKDSNLFRQMYEYLGKLPEYKNATEA